MEGSEEAGSPVTSEQRPKEPKCASQAQRKDFVSAKVLG